MSIRYKVSGVSGNANTLVAGTVTPGNTVAIGATNQKIAHLAAIVNVTAATSTLTWTGKWQVSNDNSTWIDLRQSNNAANVVLATGTSAATGDIAFDVPYAAYGFRFTRFVLVNGVVTGAAGDLYAISYVYRSLSSGQVD